jgi:hypothetical protein
MLTEGVPSLAAGVPGLDLQRLRNARGLKASQLARLAGHHAVARLLSEAQVTASVAAHASSGSFPAAAGGSGRRGARRRQVWLHAAGEARQQEAPPGADRAAAVAVTQEAVVGAIVQVRGVGDVLCEAEAPLCALCSARLLCFPCTVLLSC